ncbi:uncharacterized protein CLUP02_07306 [Colletotrichum lupini]|uniref:Uncharacterized protein n=1 Tax=Colletotrichum lupini TaxID=145971 RepID=A0A9Q8SRM7_9PEZI|nr:uncharacterized protein CLUP02_07306 [Colletotrichum lupini]UQC81820.1 hypothetical protein CLUP02_07306 [Colletotrichum lupini]
MSIASDGGTKMVSSSDYQWSQSSNLLHLKFRILFIPSTSAGVLCSVVVSLVYPITAQDWGRCGQHASWFVAVTFTA